MDVSVNTAPAGNGPMLRKLTLYTIIRVRVIRVFFVNSSVCLFSFCIVTVYMYVPGMLIMNYY